MVAPATTADTSACATGVTTATPFVPKNPIANLHVPFTNLPPVPIVPGIAPTKVSFVKPNTLSSARYVLPRFLVPIYSYSFILSNFYLIDFLAKHSITKTLKPEFDAAWASVTPEVRAVSLFRSSLYVSTDAHLGVRQEEFWCQESPENQAFVKDSTKDTRREEGGLGQYWGLLKLPLYSILTHKSPSRRTTQIELLVASTSMIFSN